MGQNELHHVTPSCARAYLAGWLLLFWSLVHSSHPSTPSSCWKSVKSRSIVGLWCLSNLALSSIKDRILHMSWQQALFRAKHSLALLMTCRYNYFTDHGLRASTAYIVQANILLVFSTNLHRDRSYEFTSNKNASSVTDCFLVRTDSCLLRRI